MHKIQYIEYQGGGTIPDLLDFLCLSLINNKGIRVSSHLLPLLENKKICQTVDGYFLFAPPPARVHSINWRERLLALLLLLTLLPLLLLVGFSIWLCNGLPVFFVQQRYGRQNTTFSLYKFRTMVHSAENVQAELANQSPDPGKLFKISDDPRTTRIGRFLRATFIDELPQLWNVFRGEMRLVGPRPLPECDQHHYKHQGHQLRVHGLPGITGLWQVSGRNNLTFDEMCLLDSFYLCNASLRLDIRVCCQTWREILSCSG